MRNKKFDTDTMGLILDKLETSQRRIHNYSNFLIVVEGYEMVGKSTFIKELDHYLTTWTDYTIIRQKPNLNHDLVEKGLMTSYSNLISVGASLANLDIKNKSNTMVTILDRGLVSSFHYRPKGSKKVDLEYLKSVYSSYDEIIVVSIRLDGLSDNDLLMSKRVESKKFDPVNKIEYKDKYMLFYLDHKSWAKATYCYSIELSDIIRVINKRV